MSFAQSLALAMAERGVDQSELARRLSISSQAVNQWLRGRTTPNGARLAQIADKLGCGLADLLSGTSEIPAIPNAAAIPRSATPADRMRAVLDWQGVPLDQVAAEMHLTRDDLLRHLSAPGAPEPTFLALFCTVTEIDRSWVMRGDLQGLPGGLAVFAALQPELSPGLKERLAAYEERALAEGASDKD